MLTLNSFQETKLKGSKDLLSQVCFAPKRLFDKCEKKTFPYFPCFRMCETCGNVHESLKIAKNNGINVTTAQLATHGKISQVATMCVWNNLV